MGKTILALMIIFIASTASAEDIDEYYGKIWRQQCEQKEEDIKSCCRQKEKKCKEKRKYDKECTPRYKVCVAKKTGSTKKTTKITYKGKK